jgi:hypothetical protein
MSLNIFQYVCVQNRKANHLATPFSRALGERRALWEKLAHIDSGNSITL